jgi:hypothetical protein
MYRHYRREDGEMMNTGSIFKKNNLQEDISILKNIKEEKNGIKI